MQKERMDDSSSTDLVVVPAAPRDVVPNYPPPKMMHNNPITIVPSAALDNASRHGSVVVATLVSATKLFDIVIKTTDSRPIATISQLASITGQSWIFGKAMIDLLQTHGVERSLYLTARKDTSILVRAVVLLLVRRIVKLDGFARAGDMLSLFQFVKVGAAIAESQGSKASQFLNEVASIPIRVFSAIAVLLSNAVDERLRQAIAIAIGSVLSEAQNKLELVDRALSITTRNAEELFYERYGMLVRYFSMRLGLPEGVVARDVLLEWRRSV